MNPALFRIAAGAALGYFILKKAGKPLHRLAVKTTKGVLDIGGCAAATGNAVYQGWQNIVEEAKTEMEEKRARRMVENGAGSVVDKVSDNVAGYMHKAAETIENMADRMEYRDNREDNPIPSE